MTPPQKRLATFDTLAFYKELDFNRKVLKYSWRQLAAQAGVSHTTFFRLAKGKPPGIDALVSLALWADIQIEDFVTTPEKFIRPERK